MKKIIYSLVIMIAAGSLFTSCVENTEPQGIRDLREAKADYLASLSKLREADAELVKAQAAYQSAQIAVVEADAALKQALANIAQALADAAQIGVEYLDAELQMKLEADKAAAEIAAVEAQKDLAIAQADLETALRKIAAESIGLTEDEKAAIGNKAFALKVAQDNYHTAFVDVENAKKAIWEKEYLHDSTDFEYLDVYGEGYGWSLKTDYNHLITLREEAIADAEDQIASDEALLEDHTAVKDSLDAMKAKVKDLEREQLAVEQKLYIYEAGEFNEAKDAYKKAIKTFKEDSVDVYETDPFAFVDLDEDENPVAKEYALTDGKKVDQTFGFLINNDWEESRKIGEYSRYSDIFNLKYDGFNYNTEKNAVEVGVISFYDEEGRHWQFNATPEALTEGLDVLNKIVETLNRDMVVVDNLTDSTTVEEAKKAAEKAWKAYTTDRDTLEGGLKDYKPYKDSLAQIAKLAEDTVKAKKAHDDAAAALKTVNTENGKKKAARIEAVKTTAAAYESAVKKLAAEIATYGNLKVAKTADSTKFIAAINAFGEAQAAFLGHQDSVKYNKGFDPETGAAVEHTDPISKLNIDFFRPKKVYQFELFNVVEKICKNTKTGDKVWDLTEKELLAAVENPLRDKNTPEDSIVAVKDVKVVAEAIKAFTDYQKVVAKAEHDEDSTKTDFANAKTKLDGYHGEDDAIAAYKEVYKRFWGVSSWDIEKDTVATKFSWTDKTFLEPTNCVKFWCNYSQILPSSTLKTILDNVDPEGYWSSPTYLECHRIFQSNERTKTEFAKALIAAQKAEDLGDYVPNKARLEKINAQVAQIKTDVEAAIAEYDAANAAYVAAWTRLTGKKDGIYHPDLYWDLVDQDKGVWKLGGKQLELANQFAPEYPKYIAEWKFEITVIQEKIDRAYDYIDVLKWCYEQQVAFETGDGYKSLEYLMDILKIDIERQKNVIESAKRDISAYKYAIAQIEAGYDPYSIELKVLYDELDKCEKALAVAEEELARAQKEYDEVIAKYGVNE